MNITAINASKSADAGLPVDAASKALHAKGLSGSALRNASEAQQRVEVAAQFEAILMRQLLGPTMTSMLGGNGDAAGSVYGDLLTDTFSQQLTRAGGLGLGRVLQQQLAPHSKIHAPTSPAASAAK
jgi:Rod binding domain-containing protein